MGAHVLVTGAGSALGAALTARLGAADPGAVEVFDPRAPLDGSVPGTGGGDGVLVLLGRPAAGEGATGTGLDPDPAATRAALAAVGHQVRHVVLLSSALVYGAWPNNPVPLDEDAPVRPVPGLAVAAAHAEDERLVAEWAELADARTATVLRPTLVLGADAADWYPRSAWGLASSGGGGATVPRQFLAPDDLVEAVVLAAEGRVEGVANVAPDGWVDVPAPAPDVPWRPWPSGAALSPPGRAHLAHPWVVDSARLHAAGWAATAGNDELLAGVAATPVAASGRPRWAVVAVVAAVVLAGLARWRRRSRRLT